MRQSRRRDQITTKIDAFIGCKDAEHLVLSLYCRDIRFLASAYPQLTFEKGEHVNNTDRVIYIIQKKMAN